MTEFESYTHIEGGERVARFNYSGEIKVENAWIEDAFEDLLDEARGDREYSVENQHLLAFIIEEFGEDIIEAAHETDVDVMLNEHIKAIEERRAKPEPTDILEELKEDYQDKNPAELEAAREAFEEKLEEVDFDDESVHEQAINTGGDE